MNTIILIAITVSSFVATGFASHRQGKREREEELTAMKLDDPIGFEQWITKRQEALAMRRHRLEVQRWKEGRIQPDKSL